MKIEYVKCEKCGRMVELNGCGSTANFYQTMLTNVINGVFPITQKLFRPCANWHDLKFHQGAFDRPVEEERVLADAHFHYLCLEEIKNPTNTELTKFDRFLIRNQPWWFRRKANQYYLALKIGSKGVFPKENCLHVSRKDALE